MGSQIENLEGPVRAPIVHDHVKPVNPIPFQNIVTSRAMTKLLHIQAWLDAEIKPNIW